MCCRHSFQIICQNPIHTLLCFTLWGKNIGAFSGFCNYSKADWFLDLFKFLSSVLLLNILYVHMYPLHQINWRCPILSCYLILCVSQVHERIFLFCNNINKEMTDRHIYICSTSPVLSNRKYETKHVSVF